MVSGAAATLWDAVNHFLTQIRHPEIATDLADREDQLVAYGTDTDAEDSPLADLYVSMLDAFGTQYELQLVRRQWFPSQSRSGRFSVELAAVECRGGLQRFASRGSWRRKRARRGATGRSSGRTGSSRRRW